jgi:hypothetical protein
MRATSRSRVTEPSGSARSTMLPNSSGEVRRPSVLTVSVKPPGETAGAWLIAPAATCRLAARMAIISSVAVRLWPATRAGSSQTRIE